MGEKGGMRGLFYTTRVPRAFPQGGAAGRLAAGTHTKRSRCNARHGARLPRLGLHVAAIPPAGARPARSAQRCAARAGPPRAAHPPEARCVKRRGTYPLRATMSLRRSVGVTTTRANCRANSLLEADAAMRPILRAPPPVSWRHARSRTLEPPAPCSRAQVRVPRHFDQLGSTEYGMALLLRTVRCFRPCGPHPPWVIHLVSLK